MPSNRRQILADVQTTLRTISVGGGYNYDVVSQSVTLDPAKNLLVAPAGDGPYYQIEPVPEGGLQYHPALQVVHTFRINITGRHEADPSDPEGKVDVWEKMVEDVEKALALDLTRSGLVVDTRGSGEPSPFVGVQTSAVFVVMPYECRLHRTWGVP